MKVYENHPTQREEAYSFVDADGRQFETIARNKMAAIAKIYYVRRANGEPISKPLRPIDHCIGDCVIIF